jgi:hypothetical protein
VLKRCVNVGKATRSARWSKPTINWPTQTLRSINVACLCVLTNLFTLSMDGSLSNPLLRHGMQKMFCQWLETPNRKGSCGFPLEPFDIIVTVAELQRDMPKPSPASWRWRSAPGVGAKHHNRLSKTKGAGLSGPSGRDRRAGLRRFTGR